MTSACVAKRTQSLLPEVVTGVHSEYLQWSNEQVSPFHRADQEVKTSIHAVLQFKKVRPKLLKHSKPVLLPRVDHLLCLHISTMETSYQYPQPCLASVDNNSTRRTGLAFYMRLLSGLAVPPTSTYCRSPIEPLFPPCQTKWPAHWLYVPYLQDISKVICPPHTVASDIELVTWAQHRKAFTQFVGKCARENEDVGCYVQVGGSPTRCEGNFAAQEANNPAVFHC